MSLEQNIAELTEAVKQLTAAILSQSTTRVEDTNQLKLPLEAKTAGVETPRRPIQEDTKTDLCGCGCVANHDVAPKNISVEDIRHVVTSQGISNTKIVETLKQFGVQNLTALDANKRTEFLTKLCS